MVSAMYAIILAALLVLPPQQSDAVIGVCAVHLESGKRLSVRNNERFPMGSVYKFPIALAVLRRVDTGTLSLDRPVTIEPRDFSPGWSPLRDDAHGHAITLTVGELVEHMVSVSDNTASDALMRLIGGPTAVSTRMAERGFGGIHINRSEKEIARDLRKPDGFAVYAVDGRDTATPDDMANLLVAFWKGRDGLSRELHEFLVDCMTKTTTGANRIKAALPPGATLAHKTGSMPGTNNDVGVITTEDGQHIALVIFTKAAKSKTEVVEEDIAAIAAKVLRDLSAQ